MRWIFVFSCALLLYSCKKNDIAVTPKQAASVSSDASVPLKYHATTFTTNYPTIAGQVPPFSFSKTLYSDTRVASLTMIERSTPNYPTFYGKGNAYSIEYKFSYSTNKAIITRMAKTLLSPWQSPSQKFECNFNNNGYCTSIKYLGFITNPNEDDGNRLLVSYNGDKLKELTIPSFPYPADELQKAVAGGYPLTVSTDANGNVTNISGGNQAIGGYASITYSYNLKSKGSNYLYQPSQYVFSTWLTMLEVMNWIPLQHNERTSVSLAIDVVDWRAGTNNAVVYNIRQGQKYLNQKYDAFGNLTSYTYGDNVLQKITWK